ncbi:MAG: thioredoxin [Chlorobiota bacterium]|nr:MAG: thioredoxin [Chlorobiota bacterium]
MEQQLTALKPEPLTAESFREKVFDYLTEREWKYKGSLPCVIDFWAEWCGPCRILAPIFEELATEYAGKVLFYKVDTDAEQELAMVFGIRSIPSLLFVPLSGKPQMAVGALPKPTLKEIIEKELIPTLPASEQAEETEPADSQPLAEDEISPAELKALLDSGEQSILLLDVRFPDEHAQRRIETEEQLLIPLPELEDRIAELEPYRDRLIIAYCRSGSRSEYATDMLRSHGFNVRNLRGGILAWSD